MNIDCFHSDYISTLAIFPHPNYSNATRDLFPGQRADGALLLKHVMALSRDNVS